MRALCAIAVAVALGACSVPSQRALEAARGGCAAGDAAACDEVAGLQDRVTAERQRKAGEFARGVLYGLVPVLGLAACGAGGDC